MSSFRLSRVVSSLFCMALVALTATSCIKKAALDAHIANVRRGGDAMGTLHDYEVAKAAALGGLAQLEGVHRLAPHNADATFMLCRGWAGVTLAFYQDDYELAFLADDEEGIAYHDLRTQAGFKRARHYGITTINLISEGFDENLASSDTLRKWLVETFTDDTYAEELTWLGFSWITYAGSSRHNPEIVSSLWVGLEILQRAVELDETVANGAASAVLASYYSSQSTDAAEPHFDRAKRVASDKYLPLHLARATQYYCAKHDLTNFKKELQFIVDAGDDMPAVRFLGLYAKRRAHRYLKHYETLFDHCSFQN